MELKNRVARLTGKRVLVAEDESIIAAELVEQLREAGAVIEAAVATVGEAMAALSCHQDCAVIDINLDGDLAWPVVEQLRARGIPVVLTSGYQNDGFPHGMADLPYLAKPFLFADLILLLETLLPGDAP